MSRQNNLYQPTADDSPLPATAGMVDVNVPRFNQGVIAVTTALAYLGQAEWLVFVAFAVLGASGFGGLSPLTWVYVHAVRPRFQPKGPTEFEPAAPPRFSQRLGAGFLGLAVVAFIAGGAVVGWALTLVVAALAALAATTRICVGCIFYERVVAR